MVIRVLGYTATCLINNKKYVGITSGTLENRIRKHLSASKRGSKYHFHEAIRYHGADAFDWQVIQELSSWGGACKWERETIQLLQTCDPAWGYNLTGGGEGSYGLSPSPATRAKISKTLKSWHASTDPRAAEVRRTVSAVRKRTKTRLETRLKQAEASRRRKLSSESRQKLSLSKRKYAPALVQEVLVYAETRGLHAAEREFSIPRTTIRRWLRGEAAFPLVSHVLQIQTQTSDPDEHPPQDEDGPLKARLSS